VIHADLELGARYQADSKGAVPRPGTSLKLDFPRKETPLLRPKLTPLFQVPFLADQVLFSSWFG